MTRPPPRYVLTALVFTLFGLLLGTQFNASRSPDDAVEQFKKMKQAFLLVTGKYVEQISAKRLATGGVEGMLDRLDPHSSYLPSEEVSRTRDRIRGAFGGVGIRYNVVNDTVRVVSLIEDGPSAQLDIRPGDRIVAIEDSTAIGRSSADIRTRLTGREGTAVTFTIHRPFSDTRRTFTVQRKEVALPSVHSAYLFDERTGYLQIRRFSRSTPDEFIRTVDHLKDRGMQRLVVDLRGNRGGVVEAAARVADEMLGDAGLTIVSVKGRASGTNRTLRTQTGGILAQSPVTLLVDGNTASSSEILAGALQDHDRALLVGRRTFGKGLVQKGFPLNDGSRLDLTVAAYYTPVGRFIQTPYEQGRRRAYYQKKIAQRREAVYQVRDYKDSIPDSLTYRTLHGRTVFGGGGILPDYVVQPDTTSLSGFLRRRPLDRFFGSFARNWFSRHAQSLQTTWGNRPEAFRSSYQVPDTTLSQFWTYAQSQNLFTLTPTPEKADPAQQVFPEAATAEARTVVETHVKGHLATVLFGESTGQAVLNQADPTVQKALSLWTSSRRLADYHDPSPSPADR